MQSLKNENVELDCSLLMDAGVYFIQPDTVLIVCEHFPFWVSSTKHWCHIIEGKKIISIIAKIFWGNNSLLITYVQICHLLCIEKLHNIVTQLTKDFHLMSFLNWETSTWGTSCNDMNWEKRQMDFHIFSYIF